MNHDIQASRSQETPYEAELADPRNHEDALWPYLDQSPAGSYLSPNREEFLELCGRYWDRVYREPRR